LTAGTKTTTAYAPQRQQQQQQQQHAHPIALTHKNARGGRSKNNTEKRATSLEREREGQRVLLQGLASSVGHKSERDQESCPEGK